MTTSTEDVMQEVMKILIMHGARQNIINILVDYHDEWLKETKHWAGEFVDVRKTAELFVCNWASHTERELESLKKSKGFVYTVVQFWRYKRDQSDAQDLKRICRRLYAGAQISSEAFSGCC